jgi:hypothetical protein
MVQRADTARREDVAKHLNCPLPYDVLRALLYEEITEPDPDKRQFIDVELDKSWRDYRARIAESLQQSPERTKQIQAASVLFDKAVADARPVIFSRCWRTIYDAGSNDF